jgi:dihydroorotate dehydrogenase (fumarate)
MANLTSTHMGLSLKNPIIVGANNMNLNADNLKRMEDAGAAAIVYKSLFEEQIHLENLELSERLHEYDDRHPEMVRIHPDIFPESGYPLEHLKNLEITKKQLSVPFFASLNAVYDETWVEYAKKIEETGVDGLELNFYTVPEKFDTDSESIESRHINILKEIKSAIKIPVSVKLSPFYTNTLKLITDLDNAGADGFVLFNRLFQPDIDIHTEELNFPYNLSNAEDHRLPLRFAGLLYGNVKASVCTSTGIFSGKDVIKMLLAGANCVQVVSTLYLNQIEVITTMLNDLEKWMEARDYSQISDFRGKLSRKNSSDQQSYRRAQYLDFVMSTTEIFKKYKVIN